MSKMLTLPLTLVTMALATPVVTADSRLDRAVREITLPAGTTLPLTLDTSVGSDTSHVEDPVRAHLRSPVVVEGYTVLPAGTRVGGYVSDAQRSGRVKGRARFALRFTTLSFHDERYEIQTSRVARQAPGTKKRDAATIAVPAGAGAVIGALTKGKKGAAVGGAIGGAGGTGVVLATRGKEVRLGRGAAVGVRLLEPLTISVPRDR